MSDLNIVTINYGGDIDVHVYSHPTKSNADFKRDFQEVLGIGHVVSLCLKVNIDRLLEERGWVVQAYNQIQVSEDTWIPLW